MPPSPPGHPAPCASVSSSGLSDGLGRRWLAFDREEGTMLERLIVRPELAAFECLLRDRIDRLAALEDERIARPRTLAREPGGTLVAISEFVPGIRLADLLDAAEADGTAPGTDAAIGFLLDVLPALCGLHAGPGFAHGTITPLRTVITPAGQIVLLDAIYGDALSHLRFSRRRLWTEFGLAVRPAAGAPALDVPSDVAQAVLSAVMLVLGRPLRLQDLVGGLSTVLADVIDVAQIRGSTAFAQRLRQLIERALPFFDDPPFATADDALIEVRHLASDLGGMDLCRSSLIDFIDRMDPQGAPETSDGRPDAESAPLEEDADGGKLSIVIGPGEEDEAQPPRGAEWDATGHVEPHVEDTEDTADAELDLDAIVEDEPHFLDDALQPPFLDDELCAAPPPPPTQIAPSAALAALPDEAAAAHELPPETPVPVTEGAAPDTGLVARALEDDRDTAYSVSAVPAAPRVPEPDPVQLTASEGQPAMPLHAPEPDVSSTVADAGHHSDTEVPSPAGVSEGNAGAFDHGTGTVDGAAAKVRARRAKKTRSSRARKDRLRSARAADLASEAPAAPPAGKPQSGGWLVHPDRVPVFDPPPKLPAQPSQVVAFPSPPGLARVAPQVVAPPTVNLYPPAPTPPVPPGPFTIGAPAAPPFPPPYSVPWSAAPVTPVGLPPPPAPMPAHAGSSALATVKLKAPARRSGASRSNPVVDIYAAPLPKPPAEAPARFPWKIAAAVVTVVLIAVLGGRAYIPARPLTEEPLSAAAAIAAAAEASPPFVPPAAPTGRLELETQPAGARVLLNDKPAGETPLTLEAVPAGRHTVTFLAASGSVRRTVRVEPGQTVRLDVPIFSGWVGIFAPFVVQVSTGGRVIGTTEEPRLMLSPGRHELTLTNRELGYRAVQSVDIEPGQVRTLTIDPRGSVSLNAVPWAEVWIDGQKVGETPLANLKLPLGTREVIFRHPQLGERRSSVTIKADAPATLSMDMNR
jgi:hypothetical protein